MLCQNEEKHLFCSEEGTFRGPCSQSRARDCLPSSINCGYVKVKQDKSRLKCTFRAALTSAFNDFRLISAQGWPGTWPCCWSFPLLGAMKSKPFAAVPERSVGVVWTQGLRGFYEPGAHEIRLWCVSMGRSCSFLGHQLFRMGMSPLARWQMESHPGGNLWDLLCAGLGESLSLQPRAHRSIPST